MSGKYGVCACVCFRECLLYVQRRDENVSAVFSLNNGKNAHFHFSAIVLAFIISEVYGVNFRGAKGQFGQLFHVCCAKNIYFPKF